MNGPGLATGSKICADVCTTCRSGIDRRAELRSLLQKAEDERTDSLRRLGKSKNFCVEAWLVLETLKGNQIKQRVLLLPTLVCVYPLCEL